MDFWQFVIFWVNFLFQGSQFFRYVESNEFQENGEYGVERSIRNSKTFDVMTILRKYSDLTKKFSFWIMILIFLNGSVYSLKRAFKFPKTNLGEND